jgi:hypothetical protein
MEVVQFTSSGWSRGETMKRILCSMLSAAAVVGCQAPAGPQHMSYKPAGVGGDVHKPQGMAAAMPAKMQGQTAKPTGDVVQVGFNQAHGLMNSTNFGRQRVAAALPSHGGMPPGPPGGMPGPGGPGPMLGGHAGIPLGPRFTTGRTQVRFAGPLNMNVGWQTPDPNVPVVTFTGPQLKTPDRYNFVQGQIYRLKLSGIPGREGVELYPTLEVYPGNAKVDAYIAHNSVPVEFTDEDFDQVAAGNYVTKVIYLPDAKYQELAIAGVETLVSTKLDPGVDPVKEAHARGSILAVIRMGSVDLEMKHSPPLLPTGPLVPPGALMPPGMAPPPPPGMFPPGAKSAVAPAVVVPGAAVPAPKK